MPFWESKTTEELQAENERLETEISVEQKREILRGLKKNGLTLKNFGGSIRSAWRWLKEH